MKNLKKLSELYNTIKSMDEEILKIERLLNALLFKETSTKFTLELRLNQPKKKEDIFDEDGSLKIRSSSLDDTYKHILSFGFRGMVVNEEVEKHEVINENEITGVLSTKMSIVFLNIVLGEMKDKREKIIKKANRLMKH